MNEAAPETDRASSWWPHPWVAAAAGLLAIVVYLVAFGEALGRTVYDVWGTFLVVPVLFAAGVALAVRVGRKEGDPWVTRLLVAALVAKFAGTVVRVAITYLVYGRADARAYDSAGRTISESLRHGHVDLSAALRSGTDFIEFITGVVYAVAGPSIGSGFFVFAFLAFVGTVFFYRAFRLAVPGGDHRRYGYLVFFLPTLLYFPSSTGKDAWMVFTVGISCYGAALVFQRQARGLIWLGVGAVAGVAVRPHITLALLAGLGVGWLLWRPPQPSRLGPVVRVGGLVALVGFAVLVAGRLGDAIGAADLDADAIAAALDETEVQTEQGGSSFTPSRIEGPLDVPGAVITLLARPFPTEADSAQMFVVAFEGMVLATLYIVGYRRIGAALRGLRASPYVTMSIVFAALFIFGFSSIANFGLLARERAQMWPLALVVLAVPALPRPARPVPAVVWRRPGVAADLASAGTGAPRGERPWL